MKNSILILNLLLLMACGTKSVHEQSISLPAENLVSLTPAQFKSANIRLGKPEIKIISSTIKVNGKIDVPPQNIISVSIPLGGYLKSTQLLPGMHIAKGEVIATMEDIQYIQLQQEYLSAKAKLTYLEAEYVRQKELNETKASSDKVSQQTQMDYTMQKI
ncbi:MAG: efflux transporter periplasmic adaptor subunit, partial [Bacteroidia bacterium]